MARLEGTGADSATLHFEDGIIWLDRQKATRAGLKPDSVLDAVAKSLRKLDGVGRVDFVKDLPKADTTRDDVARRWLHMLPPDLPADLVVSLAPYAYHASVEWRRTARRTTMTPTSRWFSTDRGSRRGSIRQKALVADMAPTLAAVAGIAPTESVDGKPRVEAIRKGRLRGKRSLRRLRSSGQALRRCRSSG